MNNTRAKILQIAVEMFAEKGFDNTSIRDIVKKANVNISAITYYFKSKEDLYVEIIKQFIQVVKDYNKDWLNLISECDQSGKNLTPDELLDKFCKIIEKFVDIIFIPKNYRLCSIFSKEMVKLSFASDLIYNELETPLNNSLIKIVSEITGIPSNDAMLNFIPTTIFGQITNFIAHKGMILRRLNLDEYNESTIEVIKNLIIKQSRAILLMYRKEDIK